MNLLPYEKFEIQTSLTLEETVAALKGEVEPKGWWFWWSSHEHAIFQGDVSRDGFKIMRIIHYMNHFLPVIRGTFKQSQNGIAVMIQMDLHPFVKTFMLIWFGGVIIFLLVLSAYLASGIISLSSSFLLLIPLAMLIFGWVLASEFFWFEARKARSELLAILHGRIESNLWQASTKSVKAQRSDQYER
ncbi:MAG: hypothetical protein IBX64_09515 [Actinobacteria bacterium]|nr:hypothetical protein [Actinomycetota bacterium]